MLRALVAVVVVGLAGAAHAEPFRWTAPESCPSASDAQTRVLRRLSTADLDGVRVTIWKSPSTYVAQIDARSLGVANQIRTLHDVRCDSLTDAVAVVIARFASEARAQAKPVRKRPVHVEVPVEEPEIADAVSASDTSTYADYAVVAEDTSSTVTTIIERDDAPVPFRAPPVQRVVYAENPNIKAGHWGGGIGVIGLSGVGALPGINVGVELSTYLRRDEGFVSLGVSRWVPGDQTHGFGSSDVSLDIVVARAGWSPQDRPLRTWLLGEYGHTHGDGVPMSSDWVAVGAGFGVAWPMAQHARIVGTFEVAVPVERNWTLMADHGLFQPSYAVARCAFGLEVGWR